MIVTSDEVNRPTNLAVDPRLKRTVLKHVQSNIKYKIKKKTFHTPENYDIRSTDSQVGIVVVCNLRHPLIAPVSKARTKYDKPDKVPMNMKRRSVGATEYPRFEVMFGYYPFDATLTSLTIGT